MEPEVLVNVSLRFPLSDRAALADHLAPLMHAAIAVGGITANVSLQPYSPDDDEGDS